MFGGRGKKRQTRIEPRLDWRDEASDDLRADPADRPPSTRRTKPAKPPSRARKGRGRLRRSSVGRLLYWTFVLGVWGTIALAAPVAALFLMVLKPQLPSFP